MNKIGAFFLSFSLLLCLFPQLTMAAQKSDFEQDFKQYLTDISKERGVTVTKDDIEMSLAAYDESMSNFKTVDELTEFLGEVISSDLSNLGVIYEGYDLDQAGLLKILQDNGDELTDYIFLDDLEDAVSTYKEGEFQQDPSFNQDLDRYLTNISTIRGFKVTREDIEKYLSSYDDHLDSYQSVNELSDFLGDVIKSDLSNLDYFHEYYKLDQKSLLDMLEENHKSINDFVFIDQLDEGVWTFSDGKLPGMDDEIAGDLLPIFEQELGLTEEELNKIEEHMASLEDKLSDPATMDKLDELASKMMEFSDFDTAAELSPIQIAELTSMYNEFLSIFELKATYSLVKNGADTPLSIADMLRMKDLKGAKLKVNLYTSAGVFLADLIISEDMVDSATITDTGKQMEESVKEVEHTVSAAPAKMEHPKHAEKKALLTNDPHKTVKGAKLPKTASDYIANALLGLAAALAGLMIFRKARTA